MNTLIDPPAHEKYLYKPLFGSSHSWAISMLQELAPDSRVLDIGAGSGALGEQLRNIGRTSLTAIEPDDVSRERLSCFYERTFAHLQDLDNSSRYDVILLLDVLEHIATPEIFLRQALNHAHTDATILISVPNIAHWSIRLLLLLGRFDYTDRGILDKTHLRFFTRHSLTKFIESFPELELCSYTASISPAEHVLPDWIVATSLFNKFSVARYRVAQVLSGIGAYQHLVKVRVKRPEQTAI